MESLVLKPVRHFSGEVTLPGSKSLTNRALLLAGLAQGTTELHEPLKSDDTRHMVSALQSLGCVVLEIPEGYRILGAGGPFRPPPADRELLSLFLGNAGTALRPLTAALTLRHVDSNKADQPAGGGRFYLHGEPRMHERPIADLVKSLRMLGANIRYGDQHGYPPLYINATGLSGGQVKVRGKDSSQFLTSLLMAAPLARDTVDIQVEGELVSQPYIDLTIALMARFGVDVERNQDNLRFVVPAPGVYQSPGKLLIEGDASSASYFLAAGAISGGPVRVLGVGKPALQGDIAFADVLAAMGAKVRYGADWIEVTGTGELQGVDLDLNRIPDAAMTLATTALFAKTPTQIHNIGNWRIKETDRLQAMATELRKLGAEVTTTESSLMVKPPDKICAAKIATYKDHRMAMSFSLAALGNAEITIEDPACVNKTFPGYFEQFAALCRKR